MSISNEDYLDGLIAKAKKSWEGVDVERYMSDLRDNSFDKEFAENLSKEVASYITEQMKSNMDKAKIKCRDLMVGDWITNRNGFPMQITNVGDDYAYATFEGNEGDPWEFDDKDDQPQPIVLTPEILEKNGWHFDLTPYEKDLNECCSMSIDKHWCYADTNINISLFLPITGLEMGRLEVHNHHLKRYLEFWICDTLYVHEMQHALRLCGLNELADNFKV